MIRYVDKATKGKVSSDIARFVIAAVMVFSICFLLATHASAQTDAGKEGERPLLFLANDSLPPLNYTKQGNPSGLVVDLARAMAKHMHRPVEIRLMNWAEAQQMILDEKADALLQINADPQRLKLFDFSEPLLNSEFFIFTSNARPDIKSLNDLRGLKVGVERMGLPDLLLRHDQRILVEYIPSFPQGFRSLAAGDIDAIVADRRVGKYVLAEHKIPGVRLVEEPILQNDSAIAVKKGNADLLKDINTALANIRYDGTYNEIIKSWQTKEVVFKTIEQLRYERLLIVSISTALVLALVSIFVMIRQIRKRKCLEISLRESEEKYRTIYENAPLGLFQSTIEGRFIEVNPALAEILGYDSPQSVLKEVKNIADQVYVRSEDRQAIVNERMRSQGVTHHLNRYRRRNGEEFIANLYLRTITDADCNFLYFEGIVEDVTEQLRAERSEQRLIALMDHNPSLVFLKDEQGQYVYLNEAYAKKFALSKDWYGKTDFDFWANESAELFRLNDANVLKSGKSQQLLEDSTDLNGTRYCWVCYKFPFSDSEGKRYVGGIGIDVTDRVLAEEALAESEEHFRLAFDQSPIGAVLTRLDNRFMQVNQAFCEMLGYSEEELLALSFTDITHPDDLEKDLALQKRLADGEIDHYRMEKRYIRKNGTIIWGLISVGRVLHAEGKPVHYMIMAQDITIQKKAEDALRKSEERFAKAFALNPSAICLTGFADSRIMDANPAFIEIFGFSREEFTGCTILELGLWPTPQDREAAITELQRNGFFRDRPQKMRTKSGEVRDFLSSAETIMIGGEQMIVSTWLDITERKRADEALRSTVQRFHQILANIFSGILVVTEDDQVEFANQHFCELFGIEKLPMALIGLTADELIENILPAYAGSDRAVPLSRIREIVQMRHRVEAEEVKMSGGRVFLRDYVPITIDGEPCGRMWQHRDITDRKQVEEELRESEARLSLAQQAARIGSFEYNPRDNTGQWSRELEMLYGLQPGGFGGSYEEWAAHVYPDDLPETEQRLRKSMATGSFEAEWRIVRPDGDIRWLAGRGQVFKDESGKPLRMVGVNLDITESKKAEEELRKSHEELEIRVRERTAELNSTVERLEVINKELQDFAFVASHDLQEPLRKIQTFCDMTMKNCAPALNDAGKEYLGRVVKSAGRMRQLLHDLLQFSRVTARPEVFETIDLGSIVRVAADYYEPSVIETGAKIEIEDMPAIEADEVQMLQLFQNLIGNALRYRSEDVPHIKVYSEYHSPKTCKIFVVDNGIGFNQEYSDLIFKPFQRLHGRGEYDGTGMGLAICRKIVERHGGMMRAESEPGKGSTFIISLPFKQSKLETVIEKAGI